MNAKKTTQRQGFKTQEFIVYPAHGVGQIISIEEQEVAGAKLELFVINFVKDKMTLRVPTSKVVSVGMRKLADCPNMFVKLSALGTFVHRATLADIQPIVSDTVTLFGAARCLWGSNFPIEKLWTDYATLVENIRAAVGHLPPHEQRSILSETAGRLYGLR